MKNGVVMKVKRDYAIVCSDENFIRIKTKRGLKQGQKIFFCDDDLYNMSNERGTIMKGYKKYIAVAVSLVILLTAVFFIRDDSFASTVVVEINPSVQLRLNSEEVVTEAEAMNVDAETFDIEALVEMQVEDAVENITNQAVDNGFLNIEDLEDDFIIISAVSKDDKDDIEKAIEEKRESSDILKAANIAILWAEEKDVENAKEQGEAVGLKTLREKYGLEENETLGDYFSNSKNREEIQNENKVIEEDIGHEVERVNANLEKMGINNEVKNELMSEFFTAKDDFIDSIKTMQEAKKSYQEALDSDDEEAIEEARAFVEETEKLKENLESFKDEVENTKDIMMAEYEEQEREEELKKIQEKVKKIRENTVKPKDAGKSNNGNRDNNNNEDENNNDDLKEDEDENNNNDLNEDEDENNNNDDLNDNEDENNNNDDSNDDEDENDNNDDSNNDEDENNNNDENSKKPEDAGKPNNAGR